jgi:hypothetical protein
MVMSVAAVADTATAQYQPLASHQHVRRAAAPTKTGCRRQNGKYPWCSIAVDHTIP